MFLESSGCGGCACPQSVPRDIALTKWTFMWKVLSGSLHGFSLQMELRWTGVSPR